MSKIGEIFKKFGPEYREKHKLPLNQLKVMAAIEKCRTPELGGHILKCDGCKKEYIQYNSCRNRHCPTCQNIIEHPHIHILIPAGALSKDESYLIPVQVLSDLFKKKFIAMFDELYLNKKIKMVGKISWLEDVKKYKRFKNKMYKKGWVVHAKKPFSKAEIAIEYLSRYLKKSSYWK